MNSQGKPWLQNWPKNVSSHLNYPDIPLQGLLKSSAQHFPNKTAIVCGEQQITYAELDALSSKFANALAKLQVLRGDRVALFLPNIPEFIISFFGAVKAGAVVTAISPLHREREVEQQLNDSGAQTIVALDSLFSIVHNLKEKTQLRNIVMVGEYEASGVGSPALWVPFLELISGSNSESPAVEVDSSEGLAALQYTGGTTGTAKGAMLTHRNFVSNAFGFAATIQSTSQDIFLTALPLFHIYGMTTSMTVPISLGAKMVLLPKFSPASALYAIQNQKVTVFCGVPTMYQLLLANLDLIKCNLTSLRVCISGASSLPPQIQRRFMEVTGGFLAEGYGLTEASPVTHCSPVDTTIPLRIGSIGLPLPDTEAQILDLETGDPLEVGEIGELAVKGPQVMKGYWNKLEETVLVLRDGWLLTGDIARMDDEGYFYIVDRKKDLIKTKDFSVYPRELEDVLYEHPAVKLCAVVGKPDALAGEIPKAYVVLKEGAVANEAEIIDFVNQKVATYKAVREVEFRENLPISGAGKVLRRMLKTK